MGADAQGAGAGWVPMRSAPRVGLESARIGPGCPSVHVPKPRMLPFR